jgi:regulator of protease activity HflC (stomatin/prohibitin superfamily)
MVLVILGIILFVVSGAFWQGNAQFKNRRNAIRLVALSLVGLGILTSTVRQIDSGSVGVLKFFGQVQKDRVLYEGLNFVNPLYDVEEMTVRQQNYTMSSVSDEGQKTGDDAVRVRCSDGLEVSIDMTVIYSITAGKAPDIYQIRGLKYEDSYIRPVIRSKIRESAVFFSATDLYSEKRSQFEGMIREKIEENFKQNGFELNQLLIRNVQLPQSVTESIERKISAKQDAQRQDYILEKVSKEAEMKRIEAQGIADAQKILTDGLNDKILRFEAIKVQKELVNSPNSKIIIMDGKSTPMILDAK